MSFDIEKAKIAREQLEKYYRTRANGCHPECEPFCVSEAARMLPAALDEIERLQSDVDGLTTTLANSGKNISINSSQQAARIRELEAENKSDKTLQNLLIDNCNSLRSRAQKAEAKTIEANHRVLDLQCALDASEARRQEVAEKITSFATSFTCPECGAYIDLPDINALQKDVSEYDICDHPGKMVLEDYITRRMWNLENEIRRIKSIPEKDREYFRRQIRGRVAEIRRLRDKILSHEIVCTHCREECREKFVSSDHIVALNNMMLTKDQREALSAVIEIAQDCMDDRAFRLMMSMEVGIRLLKQIQLLRPLLSAPHAWEVTEERKAAIRWAVKAVTEEGLDDFDEVCVLRAMLQEARP